MQVYLARHGHAKPAEVDPQRGLNAKGLRDVQKMASFLKLQRIAVDTVWHSGKARAAQTAAILAAAVTSRDGVVACAGLSPNDPVGPIVKTLGETTGDVMIVGHLPSLAKLASALVAGDDRTAAIDFPAGGVMCIEQDGRGSWALRWMLVPALLP